MTALAPPRTGAADAALPPPRLLLARRRARGFTLTPLADVMFQLLLFFMLTSALAPYALLPLGAPAGASTDAQARETPPPSGTIPAQAQAIWHLGHGEIRSGQARIALDLLPRVLEGLQAEEISELVVFVTSDARTSDLATLVEAVQHAGLARLQLVGE
ncbi:ExbD/TolR family protein [Roseinatronobacter alkalisoli]|uniref:Biopolymer transporter ExbD n=1 Tax=Roseinatronobacter alkalisoli TaxID=3028235 RepID=A0ABT5TA09_9RHOB|nr:biopolymer transporter ExbD [Roseinatronobacter sp. HJB301]MDD7971950.1 biopolymer transporter ExbD [Roseinatronobacter sp. HJB301]